MGSGAGGEEWPDYLFAQDHKSSQGSYAFMQRLIAARGSDLLHHVLAAEFLDVIGGAARTIGGIKIPRSWPELSQPDPKAVNPVMVRINSRS